MKKKRLLALIAMSFVAAGCMNNDSDTEETTSSAVSSESSAESSSESQSSESEVTSSEVEETAVITDYFPFDENVFYSYIGEGNEFASYDKYPQYIEDNRIQFSTVSPGTTTVSVLEYVDGKLVENFRKGETYYRENILDQTNDNTGNILLQEPLEVGTNWTNPSGSTSEITSVAVDVETPLGVFPALEVTTTEESSVLKHYYALDMGLIKEEFTDNTGGGVVTSTLQARNEETPQNITVKAFYPDANAMGLDTSDVNVAFFTNDVTRETFSDLLKQVPDVEFGQLIPAGTSINSMYLNEDGRVYIDFSQELVSEMNAGSSGESLILQGIVNTVGTFYGVQEVVITVEGAPYESGHYSMQEGESFKVDMELVNE